MPVGISEEHSGRVVRLSVESDPGNPLRLDLLQELIRTLDSLASHPTLVAVVLEGRGRDFSVGLTSRELTTSFAPLAFELFHRVALQLASLPALLVSAVRGRCEGAAFELTLFSQAVVIDATARFQPPNPTGLHVPTVAALVLPDRVGWARAEPLLLSDTTVRADQAVSLGLATHAASGWESLETLTERVVGDMALSAPPDRIRATVRAMRLGRIARLTSELETVRREAIASLTR